MLREQQSNEKPAFGQAQAGFGKGFGEKAATNLA